MKTLRTDIEEITDDFIHRINTNNTFGIIDSNNGYYSKFVDHILALIKKRDEEILKGFDIHFDTLNKNNDKGLSTEISLIVVLSLKKDIQNRMQSNLDINQDENEENN